MRLLTYLLPLMVFIMACGGGSSDQNQQQANNDINANNVDVQESTASQSNQGRTIDIIGVDQMKYVVKNEQEGLTTGNTVGSDGMLQLETITAEPGEEITIRLTTQSKLPATAMSHNFILLKRSADPEAFDKAAIQARDNDYIPSDMSDQIIAHTELASGGETVEVTFNAPEETGENKFMCSFPGHFAAGMEGTLKVE